MAKYFVSCLVLAIALQIGGCSGLSNVQPVSQAEHQALTTQATQTPRLQRGDKVRVTVFGEDKLDGTYEIDPGGAISLPLAGTVQAVGLTKAELEQLLTKKFRSEYLKNPKVTVDIAAFRPFYMFGEVAKPGEYPFKPGLNIVSATAMAGGITFRARPNVVLIQHAGETEMKEYRLDSTVPVLPGDMIRIPERYL